MCRKNEVGEKDRKKERNEAIIKEKEKGKDKKAFKERKDKRKRRNKKSEKKRTNIWKEESSRSCERRIDAKKKNDGKKSKWGKKKTSVVRRKDGREERPKWRKSVQRRNLSASQSFVVLTNTITGLSFVKCSMPITLYL